MRQLHPVGFREKFVASGAYAWYCDDQPTGAAEQWTIHELPDGAQIIRVDYDGKGEDGQTILIEAWINPDDVQTHRIERFDMRVYNPPDAAVKHARGTYTLHEDYIEVVRVLDDQIHRQEEIQGRIGFVIPAWTSCLLRGFACVWSANNPDAGGAFTVRHSQADLAAFGGEDYMRGIIVDMPEIAVLKNLEGLRHLYDADMRRVVARVDRFDVAQTLDLLRDPQRQQSRVAALTRYARRPEPPAS